MHIQSYGMTDRGRVRETNEDAFFMNEPRQLYAVADGLGGLPGGAEASQRTIELISQAVDRSRGTEDAIDWSAVMEQVHRTISDESLDAHPFTGSGSTLTLAHIIGDQLTIAHVGDSAAYRLRDGQLTKLTTDHTQEQEWIAEHGEAGRASMPPEMPHTLTRCIGQPSERLSEQTVHPLEAHDCLLLCTDGLNKVVPEPTIQSALLQAEGPEDACEQLIELANENRGPDNITVIVLKVT